MLLWIDENLLAFRRVARWHSVIVPDKTSLFVYRQAFAFKLCRGDFDDAGFADWWVYPDMVRAIEVCFTWDGIGDAPIGWTQSGSMERPGKRCRPDGDPAKEYVKDLPKEKEPT